MHFRTLVEKANRYVGDNSTGTATIVAELGRMRRHLGTAGTRVHRQQSRSSRDAQTGMGAATSSSELFLAARGVVLASPAALRHSARSTATSSPSARGTTRRSRAGTDLAVLDQSA